MRTTIVHATETRYGRLTNKRYERRNIDHYEAVELSKLEGVAAVLVMGDANNTAYVNGRMVQADAVTNALVA